AAEPASLLLGGESLCAGRLLFPVALLPRGPPRCHLSGLLGCEMAVVFGALFGLEAPVVVGRLSGLPHLADGGRDSVGVVEGVGGEDDGVVAAVEVGAPRDRLDASPVLRGGEPGTASPTARARSRRAAPGAGR